MSYKFHEANQSVLHRIEELIQQYHPALHEARISVVLREDEEYRPKSPHFYGKTQLVPAQFSPWMEADFLLVINEDEWIHFNDAQRDALLDHLLCHCYMNPNTEAWTTIKPDVVEFSAVIGRHGFWNTDLDRASQAHESYMQKRLPGLEKMTIAAHGRVVSVTGEQLEKLAQSV